MFPKLEGVILKNVGHARRDKVSFIPKGMTALWTLVLICCEVTPVTAACATGALEEIQCHEFVCFATTHGAAHKILDFRYAFVKWPKQPKNA